MRLTMQDYEKKGFEALKDAFEGKEGVRKLEKMQDYFPYDAVIHSTSGGVAAVEIKYRRMESSRYNKYFLNVHKRDRILDILNTDKGVDKAYFFCFFEDGVAYVWDFENTPGYDIEKRDINTGTARNVAATGKRPVDRVMCPVKDAIKIDLRQ